MIRAGKLKHRIQIERQQRLVADNGTTRNVWLPILTTLAEVRDSSTEEFFIQQIEGNQHKVVFVIRWPMQEITTADRIAHAGRVWNIIGIVEIGHKRGLQLRAVAA